MTYSLVARDPSTGELGVAVQSHWFSVGSVVPHVHPAVGAVATQSVPDPAHGARLLALLADRAEPRGALDAVLRDLPAATPPPAEPSRRSGRRRGLGRIGAVAPVLALIAALVVAVAAVSDGEGLWLLWPLGFLWLKLGWWGHRHRGPGDRRGGGRRSPPARAS